VIFGNRFVYMASHGRLDKALSMTIVFPNPNS